MRNLQQLALAFIFTLNSCSTDDYTQPCIEAIFVENPKTILIVDIVYVLSSSNLNEKQYNLNESKYIKNLNSCYFHRYDIGLILGETRNIINDELYDLKDNIGEEASTFFKETQASFKKDRLNIYIIKRSNIIAIAGMGKSQRALITEEFLNKSTSPHEIGHALGLYHTAIEGNIMCHNKSAPRIMFNQEQVKTMTRSINAI